MKQGLKNFIFKDKTLIIPEIISGADFAYQLNGLAMALPATQRFVYNLIKI